MRRVERSARVHGTDRDEGAMAIAQIIERFQAVGYIDDQGYAVMYAGSLFRRGSSLRAIRYKLVQKGVPEDTIETALAGLAESVADPDRQAAVAYARRRRIGPWRQERREEARDRDLAALGRQGFSYGIARWVVDAESPEICEASLTSGD
ncbi:MAG: RecX family transcriptional regulator [Rickettsiales bacterium]